MSGLQISPSILSADLTRLGAEVHEVEQAGVEMIHIDVMDGQFVPNITWGAPIVSAVRRVTTLPLDVHLMIASPDRYIEQFAEAGADLIGIHVEADVHAQRTLSRIRALGKRSCITLNPQTGLETIDYLLEDCDQVLLMSVNPGFGGQKFLPQIVRKIRALRERINQRGLKVDIEVDGGIARTTVREVWEAGANVVVAGAAIFGQPDRRAAVQALREAVS